jgi:peptidoglycan-N-acetylglucosamine deacetylase
MTIAAPAGRRAVPPPEPPDVPVFLNPSGRRWRLLRATGLLLLAALLGFLAVAVPRVLAPPALDGRPVPAAPSVADLGGAQVIGQGPLIRIVRLLRDAGGVYAQEPFTGQVVSQLPAEDVRTAGGAAYAIQRYGYSESAHKTISLTFDDGPNPVWTPRLLDLLSANEVPATFFVTGEQMVRYPEVMRRMAREGFAIGNHSLSHIDFNETTQFRTQVEVAVTDRIMRAGTGRYASYVRLPYEGDDEQTMRAFLRGMLRTQQLGYVVASHDFDSLDWAYESGRMTGEIPLPPLGEQDNITVLLHDAGGNRAQTLAYVEKLITAARAAGYTFHTMPQVQPELQARTGTVQPTVWDRIAFGAAFLLFDVPDSLLEILFVVAVSAMLGIGLLNAVLALLRARIRGARLTSARPPVSVVVAAYNEELVISRTLRHLLASDYPVAEVLVVDDGSTDGTAEMVRDIAAGDRRVRLLQQANSGKPAALNRAFAEARHDFVITLDADTVFTPETVGHLMARFSSARVGAVAGVIKVGNYRRNLLTRWQALEYLTQIGVDRAAAAYLNAVMVIPGACAAWRRVAVLEAGGYSEATLAEDCDLTLSLHRFGWRVEQADEAVAYTEAPETLDALLRQRVRWMFGSLQAIWRHRAMLLRPRHGWLGMLFLPMAVITIVLPLLFTPLVVIVLLQMLAAQGPLAVLVYVGLFAAVQGVLAVVAVCLLRERGVHLVVVPLYRFIYEPLRAYLLYACLGTALRGVRLGWNKLARTANMDALEEEPAPVPGPVPAPGARPAQVGS